MTTFVALLRAVNVSGKNRIPMAELRASLEAAGFLRVRTCLQSGSVVVDAATTDEAEHAAAIRAAVERRFCWGVGVQALAAARLARIAAENPFPAGGADEQALHVTFLEEPAAEAAFVGLDLPAHGDEQAVVAGRVVYLHLPHGYGRTRLNNAYFERVLKTSATTRNWRTVLALVEMSGPDI